MVRVHFFAYKILIIFLPFLSIIFIFSENDQLEYYAEM